ncbi:MAG: NADP-dependent oxidoreductase [Subtercola sp.]|nr:NADP-dependent oxidoreductase [Subtercola sp.]
MLTDEHALRVTLRSRPVAMPVLADFALEQTSIPQPAAGEVLVRTIYLSLDPYMRGRISSNELYETPVAIGETILGGTVGEVLQSRADGLAPGDFVLGMGGWQSHFVAHAADLTRLDPSHAPLSTALGVLGVPGFTGFAGLREIGKPQPGETVVVAAASGAVGTVVGRTARAAGARVVGIAGGAEKVSYLNDFGFDAAVDHRSPTFAADLAAAAPNGIDVYFENVGGAVWEAVMPLLNPFARIPVSGLVAHYNEDSSPSGVDRLGQFMRTLQMKRFTIRGFVQSDFVDTQWEAFQREVAGWIAGGSFDYREDIVTGLENAPQAFIGLLSGRNFGKLLVRVAAEETDVRHIV